MKKSNSPPPENRFCLCPLFEFRRDEGRSGWSICFEAYHIVDSPKKNQDFVILEHHYSHMNCAYFISSFFDSEESMRTAFFRGVKNYLELALNPRPPKKKSLSFSESLESVLEEVNEWRKPHPYFAEFPGHLDSTVFDNFETPWFLAKVGQRIYREKVVEKVEAQKELL